MHCVRPQGTILLQLVKGRPIPAGPHALVLSFAGELADIGAFALCSREAKTAAEAWLASTTVLTMIARTWADAEGASDHRHLALCMARRLCRRLRHVFADEFGYTWRGAFAAVVEANCDTIESITGGLSDAAASAARRCRGLRRFDGASASDARLLAACPLLEHVQYDDSSTRLAGAGLNLFRAFFSRLLPL